MPQINNAKVFKKMDKDLTQFNELFAKEFHKRLVRATPNPPSLRADGTGPSTGNLKNSWQYMVTRKSIEFTNTAEYASYVERGTPKMPGAHMLRNTKRQASAIAKEAARKAKGKG